MDCEKYSFQLLKNEEIVEFINKLGFKVDKSTIESNDSDTIVELYCSLMDKLGIVKRETLKIRFDGMGMFAYPGLHDRPIFILKLFKKMKSFIVDVIGIENFVTADLFSPNPKRNKRLLSGIIRFFKFKQAEKDTVNTIRENYENSFLIYKENVSKFQKANSNYQKIKEIIEKEKPQIEECMDQLNTLNITKSDVDNKLQELELKLKEKSLELEDTEEKIRNIDNLNESLLTKINYLKTQIVHSPDKIILLIEELKLSSETQSNIIQESEMTIKNSDKLYKILDSVIKEMIKFENTLIDLESIDEKLKNVNKIIYEENGNKLKLEKNNLEFNSKIDNMDKTIKSLKSYCEEFHDKQKKIVEIRDESLMQLKEKSQGLIKRLNDLNEMIKNQNVEISAVEAKINEIDSIKNGFAVYYENEMNNLLNLVMQYSTKMNKLLENSSINLNQ